MRANLSDLYLKLSYMFLVVIKENSFDTETNSLQSEISATSEWKNNWQQNHWKASQNCNLLVYPQD